MWWLLAFGYGLLRLIGGVSAASRGRGGRFLARSYVHRQVARSMRRF